MKYKKFLIFSSLFFVLCIGYLGYVKFFFIDSIKDFDKKVEMQLKENGEVDFSKIVEKEYDEILVVYPYLPKEHILEKTGIDLNKTRKNRDGIFIKNIVPIATEGAFQLVFLKGKKIVALGDVFSNVDLKTLEKFEKDGIYIIPKDGKIKIVK